MKRSAIKRGTSQLKRSGRVRPVSAKKRKKRASPDGQASIAYMGKVKELPCCVCGRDGPSQAHHCTGDGMPRNDWHVIPLCYDDHQGPEGYHARKKPWEDAHGKDYSYIDETQIAILGEVRHPAA